MDTVTEEDWRSAPALQETPVTSAICEPANGAHLEEGTDEVPGLLSAHTNACPLLLPVLRCSARLRQPRAFTVLCCAVPCRAVPSCALLCCAMLCRAVPCHAVLCRAEQCCAVPCCAVLLCAATLCSLCVYNCSLLPDGQQCVMLAEPVGSQPTACSLAKRVVSSSNCDQHMPQLCCSNTKLVTSESAAVRGYAYSGGGRNIIRVDVSADNGQTWHVATIDNPDQLPFR